MAMKSTYIGNQYHMFTYRVEYRPGCRWWYQSGCKWDKYWPAHKFLVMENKTGRCIASFEKEKDAYRFIHEYELRKRAMPNWMRLPIYAILPDNTVEIYRMTPDYHIP